MRAIAIENCQLKAVQQPIPKPGVEEVLIKVAYAGINRADLLQVAGKYPPPDGASALPGMEVSGWLEDGTEVCALMGGGGYAEYAVAPALQVLRVPHGLSLKEAASLPEAAATAYMALAMEAQLRPGERVLVHGGSSGTGNMIAQVAIAWGAEVYATAGGAVKCAALAKQGIHPIDHKAGPWPYTLATAVDGVDVIIDILGGPQLATHLSLLRPGGRLVSLAVMEGGLADGVKMGAILMKHLKIIGTTLRSRSAAQKAAMVDGVRSAVWPFIEAGVIRPVVDSVFPLESAEKAHQRMQERLHLGKILLEVAP